MPAALIAVTVKNASAETLEDRGDDRDEIGVEFKARQEAPDQVALEGLGGDDAESEKDRERQQPQKRHVMPGHIKKRLFEQNDSSSVQV